jgi:hypothetical protein
VGLPESLIENITLENVTITAKEGLKIANARGVTLTNVKIIPEKGEPVTLFNAKMASAPVKPAN